MNYILAFTSMMSILTAINAPAHAADFDRYGIYGVGHPGGEHLVGDSDSYQKLLWRRIAEAGATSVRIAVSWREIEAEKGRYDWEQIDRPLGYLKPYPQIRPYLLVVNTPGWARSDGKSTHYAPAPEFLPDFKRFCRDAAARFKGRVRHYEVWNEQNGFGWEVPPFNQVDKYLPVLQAAYDGLKEGNPDCIVSLGGLDNAAGHSPIFTRGSYELRLKDYGNRKLWDAFADHPYGDRASMMAKERAIKGIAAGFGDCDLELWLTEYGFRVDDGGEEKQAKQLTEYMTAIISDPELRYITETNYLCVADFDGSHGFGLCDANLRPREAFRAYQRLPRPGKIVISDIRLRYVSPTEVELTWSTDADAQGAVTLSSPAGKRVMKESTAGRDHMMRVAGLTPGTDYAYTLSANAEGLPETISLEYPFRTLQQGKVGNAGFEEPFRAGIAPLWECRGSGFCFDSASERLRPERRLARSGAHAQCIVAAGRFGDALNDVVMAQAGATPGKRCTFSIWTHAVADNPGQSISRQVGIDPSGGTDPSAKSVVWSETASAQGKWEKLSVSAEASGTVITLFARARADGHGDKDQYFYADDAELTED